MTTIKLNEAVQRITISVTPEKIPLTSSVLGMENIESFTGLITWPPPQQAPVRSNKNVFSQGDLLFGRLRPQLRKVVVADSNGFCSPELIVLRPLDPSDAWYLWTLLRSDQIHRHIESRIVGASLPRISSQQLLALDIPWPGASSRHEIGRKAQILLGIRIRMAALATQISLADRSLQESADWRSSVEQ